MSKNIWVALSILWFLIATYLYFEGSKTTTEPTCEEMVVELWAFQQCLANRPACSIQGGQDSYARYHKIRNRFEVQCGEDRGDAFLSQ